MRRTLRNWRRPALFLAMLAALAGCHRATLPESGTYPARLYAARCGTCHAAYNPRSMTAAMWQVQLQAMEPRMAATGHPLSDDDRRAILEYLTRNAGG